MLCAGTGRSVGLTSPKVTGLSRSTTSTLVADLRESGFVAERSNRSTALASLPTWSSRSAWALPGPVDASHHRLHDSAILEGWMGVDVAADLRERLSAPIHIDNDANLGALAEVTLGAGRRARTAIYLQLSSGVGAGLVVAGQPFHGATRVAGEVGHVTVAEGGLLCRCGRRGCLETLVSGPAIVEQITAIRGERLPLARIVDLAHAGDADCRAAIAEAGRLTGMVLADVCNLLNPEIVVVGGELSGAGQWLLEPLRAALLGRALPATTRDLRVVGGELGDRANCLGALALAISRSEQAVAARIRASRRT